MTARAMSRSANEQFDQEDEGWAQDPSDGQELPASAQKPKCIGQGRRIQRLLGYCRYCDRELERNTLNPRKCDGGGMGSILGNYVIMAGVFAMMISATINRFEGFGEQFKLRLRDCGMLLLFVGFLSEKAVASRQSSCCCRCAVKHRDLSLYCRRVCHFCQRRINSSRGQ